MITTYRRIWCKTCNEFELHTQNDDKSICNECGTEYTDVFLKDIPTDKLEEQRERWKESQRKHMDETMKMIMNPGYNRMKELIHMFSEPKQKIEISESDAGQEEIDKMEREEFQRKQEIKRRVNAQYQDYIKKFKGVNRNELCPCGSGLKYKKCCENNKAQFFKYKPENE